MVQAPAGLEDDLRGFGIVIDVGLGRSVHVTPEIEPPIITTSFTSGTMEGFQQGQGYVGERADGDEGDLVGRLVNHLNDQVGAEARIGFAFAGRQLDVRQTVGAMPEFGGDQLLK